MGALLWLTGQVTYVVLIVATQEAACVTDADHMGPMPSCVEGHHLVLAIFLCGSMLWL